MGIKPLRNSLKIIILDKELGSSGLFLRYTKDNYFWRKAILVDRRSDCHSVYLQGISQTVKKLASLGATGLHIDTDI